MVRTYAEIFAYGVGTGGDGAALTEGLLRLQTCSMRVESLVAGLWQDLTQAPLTVAQDSRKQRADHLFGLDGKAGLLAALDRFRRRAALELPAMSGARQAEFLAELITFAGSFLPDGRGIDLWADAADSVDGACRTVGALALLVYLQAVALIMLVQGLIGGLPGPAEEAQLQRHRRFLGGDAPQWAERLPGHASGSALAAIQAAAQVLMV